MDAIYINHYNKLDWALDHWETGQKLKPDVDYQWERLGLTSKFAFTHNTGRQGDRATGGQTSYEAVRAGDRGTDLL